MQQQKGITMTKKLPRARKNGGAGANTPTFTRARTPLGECASLHFSAKSGSDIFSPKASND
jgi:hypothetical protein